LLYINSVMFSFFAKLTYTCTLYKYWTNQHYFIRVHVWLNVLDVTHKSQVRHINSYIWVEPYESIGYRQTDPWKPGQSPWLLVSMATTQVQDLTLSATFIDNPGTWLVHVIISNQRTSHRLVQECHHVT